jgi:hypothetical protein
MFLQGDEISDIVKEMEALPLTSKLRQVLRSILLNAFRYCIISWFLQWLSMVLRRQGQLTSGDGRSSGNIPLASPRPSVDPSAIRIQPPRKSAALSPVKSSSSDKAASNVAVKSLKTGKLGYSGMTPALTPRRVGQDVDPKILQMAAHAASLRPPTTKSDVSASDVGFSVLRGSASGSRADSTLNQKPDDSHLQKTGQPPLPPHALPPPHAHRKPNVRDRKNEGV